MPLQAVKSPRPELLPFQLFATSLGWHQLSPFSYCAKEYQYSRVRKVVARGPYLSEPLSIGLLVHTGTAQWLYDGKRGDLWRRAMTLFAQKYEAAAGMSLAPAALPVATRCLEAYVAHWTVRRTPRVLALEYELKPRPLTPSAPPWTWRSSRLDGIEQYQGKTYIRELKTTSSGPGKVRDIFMLHGQTLLGCCLWSVEETKRFGPLAGVLLDVLVKPSGKREARCSPRIALVLSEMEHALGWFKKDFVTWVMQTHLIDWNSHVPRHLGGCMRPHGPCDYRRMCLRGQRGAGGFVFSDTGKPIAQWEPEAGKEVPPWD